MGVQHIRPVLKWPGGKYHVLPRIFKLLPRSTVLVEPFLGSGAVSLNWECDGYLLNDANPHVMGLYRCLDQFGRTFMDYAQQFFAPFYNNPTVYNQLREEFNHDTLEPCRRAALFLYLNRHGYNGLCRYNRKGCFNVPFGRHSKPYFPLHAMQRMLSVLSRSTLYQEDFRRFLSKTPADSVVYADPPYMPLEHTVGFTQYAPGGFHRHDHVDLAEAAHRLSTRGVPVVLSNHDTPFVRRLYRAANLESFAVRRCISCKTRRKAPELLALFLPKRAGVNHANCFDHRQRVVK